MQDAFEKAFTYLLRNEKGLEENSNDPGGITKYGISLRFLKSLSSECLKKYCIYEDTIDSETVRHLTVEQARCIYYGEFWEHAPFEKIEDYINSNYIFDMAVNMGISVAIKCVQRACWSVFANRNIVSEDGILGEKTLKYINNSGAGLNAAMRSERAAFYKSLVDEKPALKEFLDGWLNRAYGV